MTFGKVMHVVVVCGFFFCEMQISSALKHLNKAAELSRRDLSFLEEVESGKIFHTLHFSGNLMNNPSS